MVFFAMYSLYLQLQVEILFMEDVQSIFCSSQDFDIEILFFI